MNRLPLVALLSFAGVLLFAIASAGFSA